MKNKHKILGLIGIVWLLSFAFSFGQNLWDIQTNFCENSSDKHDLNLVTKADQKTEICISFTNKSDSDLTLQVDFVDGTLTDRGNRSCLDSSKAKPNFGQHVLDWQKEITIPAKQTKTEKYFVKFPVGYSGVSHGCLIYNVKSDNKSSNINVVFSKSHSIDILVWWVPISPKLKANSFLISGDQINNRLILGLSNKGNTDLSVQITGNISNSFGYNQDFSTEENIIPAGESVDISSSKLSLPDYKWIFRIKTNISYQPHFNFHITNPDLKSEYTEAGQISFSKIIVLRNWFYIGAAITIAALLSIIIFKKSRK